MAKKKASKKDRTTAAAPAAAQPKIRLETKRTPNAPARPLTFGPETYKWMGIGFAMVVIGLLLMSGGRGDDPAVYDESVIYSFRKITLAPIVILSGLGVVIYAILKK